MIIMTFFPPPLKPTVHSEAKFDWIPSDVFPPDRRALPHKTSVVLCSRQVICRESMKPRKVQRRLRSTLHGYRRNPRIIPGKNCQLAKL